MRRSSALLLVPILLSGSLALAAAQPTPQPDLRVVVTPDAVPVDMVREPAPIRASRTRPVLAHPTFVAAPRATTPAPAKARPQRPAVVVPAAPRAVTQAVPVGAFSWAHSRSGYRVSNCESGDRHAPDVNTRYSGDAHLRDRIYYGKWQMNSSFWSTYGGLAYASRADLATESQQDAVAYKGFLARKWQPWQCSVIMGVR